MKRIAFASASVSVALLAGCGGNATMATPDLGVSHPALKPFSDTFLWGTATAPYQIEGGLHHSDWYEWESTSANPTGARSDDGDHSYDLFDTDNQLAADMHNNTMRIGIDFSRLFPAKDNFPTKPDPVAVAHYHDVFKSMKAHHLVPMVTLYHWVLPTWLQDLGAITDTSGWQGAGMPDTFAQFAGWAGKEYGGEVDLWVTLNEPMVNLLQGYITGGHPPLLHYTDAGGIERVEKVFRNMVSGAAKAYDALHAADTADADGDGKPVLVGIAFPNRVFQAYPVDDPALKAANELAAKQLAYLWNDAFLNGVTRGDLDGNLDGKLDGPNDLTASAALKNRIDWIGENYYGLTLITTLGSHPQGPLTGLPTNIGLPTDNAKTEFGWDIYPDGLRTVLDELATYKLPIYITENGIADSTDGQRPRFLIDHLYVLEKAIADGIDVRGYYHWSLLDNLEWGGGYCPKFGLAAVDFSDPNRRRAPRGTASLFKDIIDAKTVSPSLFDKYPGYPDPTMHCKGGG